MSAPSPVSAATKYLTNTDSLRSKLLLVAVMMLVISAKQYSFCMAKTSCLLQCAFELKDSLAACLKTVRSLQG